MQVFFGVFLKILASLASYVIGFRIICVLMEYCLWEHFYIPAMNKINFINS